VNSTHKIHPWGTTSPLGSKLRMGHRLVSLAHDDFEGGRCPEQGHRMPDVDVRRQRRSGRVPGCGKKTGSLLARVKVCKKMKGLDRVTRLGGFSPIGRLFTLGIDLKSIPHIWATLFHG
jgi:hypothetical protein